MCSATRHNATVIGIDEHARDNRGDCVVTRRAVIGNAECLRCRLALAVGLESGTRFGRSAPHLERGVVGRKVVHTVFDGLTSRLDNGIDIIRVERLRDRLIRFIESKSRAE